MKPIDSKPAGEAICERLIAEIHKLGFPPEAMPPLPVYERAGFETAKDPYSGQESLCGVWRNERGYRIGEIKLHADGSCYAEYDVALPHPTNARWFVEGVIAWGRDDIVKAEAKLLPAPG